MLQNALYKCQNNRAPQLQGPSVTFTDFLSSFDLTLVAAYVVMMMTLNFSPGPAVLKVISDAVAHGIRPAHASMGGIFAANMMYAVLAVLGMGALILAFPALFEIVKWLGVAYLLFMAFNMLRSAFRKTDMRKTKTREKSGRSLFLSSFAVQGANPKSVLTFCVTLPIFAGPGEGIEYRMIALALLNNFLEYPVLLIYSYLGSKAAQAAANTRFSRAIDIASATALGAAATMVARTSLPAR